MRRRLGACGECLRRAWLLARLSGHIDRERARLNELLGLDDVELVSAIAPRRERELIAERRAFRAEALEGSCRSAGVTAICRCRDAYPARLRELSAPPAVVFVGGSADRFLELGASAAVALVGSRRASASGIEVAHALARDLAARGVVVISGMASGVDSAAHRGALELGARTIAVLPGSAELPYPAGARALHRRLCAAGAVASELPPGTPVRNWTFAARNRLIAALAEVTVVVEAAERSGALVTAGAARALGRPVAAVPGRITSPAASGSNRLLVDGASAVCGSDDVVALLPTSSAAAVAAVPGRDEHVAPELRHLLRAVAEGHDTPEALCGAGFDVAGALAGLSALELSGHVRRVAGGRFAMTM